MDLFRIDKYRGPCAIRMSVPATYLYETGIQVSGELISPGAPDLHAEQLPKAIAFGANDAWTFQHFMQDVLYVIHAHRDVLESHPEIAIAVATFRDTEPLIRHIGLQNPILRLPTTSSWFRRKWVSLPGPVWVVNFAPPPEDCGPLAMPFRRDLIARLQGLEPGIPQDTIILICRAHTQSRAWANEEELIRTLQECAHHNGLQFLRFAPHETDSTESTLLRLSMFRRARAVVSVHGGAAYHVMACRPGSVFIEVTVPDSFSFEMWIEAANLRYTRMRASTGGHNTIEPVEMSPEMIRTMVATIEQGIRAMV